MNIQLIRGPLEASDDPGLSTIDPRFSDIATLVQEGNYEEASVRSEEILAEEIYDIRIMGYFLYGVFLEQGIGAMEEIFQALAEILRDNIEAVGPLKNREKHIQTILNWLMRQLAKKLQYEEEKKAALWGSWLEDVSSDQVQESLEAAVAFRRAVGSVLEEKASPVLDGLTKINEWLSRFQMLVYREPEPASESEEAWEEEADDIQDDGVENTGRKEKAPRFGSGNGGSVSLNGSYPLQLLILKIRAFDRLIQEEKLSRAALVADDINHIIENFDPRAYFPELFSNFTLQYATNINGLSAFEDHKTGIEWQAMQELYKVDLESFVHFDSDGIELSAPGMPGMNGQGDAYEDMPEDGEGDQNESYEEGMEDDEW